MSSRIALAGLTVVSVGALATPANAATSGVVSVVETTKVQYKAAKGATNTVVVTRSGRTITIDDRVPLTAGKGCKAVKGDRTKVQCTPATAPTRIRVYLGDKNDSVVNQTDLGMSAYGGSGNDRLTGGPRSDNLHGGTGGDKMWGLGGRDYLLGQDGNDRLSGGDGDDNLDGGIGNDTLYGGNGNDDLWGMEGDDAEYGGAGRDVFWETFDPFVSDADRFSGGSGGDDAVAYVGRDKAVTADADGVTGDDGAKNEHDTIGTDVEEIDGGAGNDLLKGTGRRDVLYGGRGNDTLLGGGGNDFLFGQAGKDHLEGGAGNDLLSGDDNYYGGPATDVLLGGSGQDTVTYTDHSAAVTVDLDGSAGDDGQAGEHDTVGADVEGIVGGAGNDKLTGNAADNVIYAGSGNDVVHAGAGNDVVVGEDGRDSLYGEAGDDELDGDDAYNVGVPDRLDGGADATAAGDLCRPEENDVVVNCERDRP
ncbi:calcium-binding protein [Krasilnikovia sp. MM14-A1004]|uniref:calcium-binding protein n=1 Tax=Krasilnikovia sp. MM14-A1004 TaxID=3373541 RepID=UPI00399D4BE9